MILFSVIFATSAVVSYRTFFSTNQLLIATDRVENALRYARMMAITLHTTILFCARNADDQCGSNWQQGQLVMNENTNQVLRYFPSWTYPYRLLWRSTLGESDALAWRSTGFTRGQQGSFFVCAQDPTSLSAQIIILRTGRLRSTTGYFSACKS